MKGDFFSYLEEANCFNGLLCLTCVKILTLLPVDIFDWRCTLKVELLQIRH